MWLWPRLAASPRGGRRRKLQVLLGVAAANLMLSLTLAPSVFQSLVLVALALLWCSAEAMPGPSALPDAAAVASPDAAPDAAADPEAWRRYGYGGGYYRPTHSILDFGNHHHHIICGRGHCHDIPHYH